MCPWALDGHSSAGACILESISVSTVKMVPGTINAVVREKFGRWSQDYF